MTALCNRLIDEMVCKGSLRCRLMVGITYASDWQYVHAPKLLDRQTVIAID